MAHHELTWSVSPSNSLSGAQQPCVFKTYKSSKSFADQSCRLFPAAPLLLQLCFELFLPALRAEHTIAYRKNCPKSARSWLKSNTKMKQDNRLRAGSHMLPLWTGVSFPGEHCCNEGMAPEA